MYSMVIAPFCGQDVLVLVLILCCWSLLWVWPWVEPEAAQPLEYQTITRCIWKEKLQSTDASALLELWAWSAGWLLNCHMLCANIPANVGQGDFGSLWQSPCTVLQKNLLVPPPWPLPGCPGSWSRVEMSSFGSWDVVRREKRENGLFLPKPSTSFRGETDRQTWNHHGNQNKYPEHMTLSEMFLLSFWIVPCHIISSGRNQHFMEKCFPISFA